jgi:F0F1-type ATP synthase membrane subunit c/vacuolar-type H+-ATPase subunit K
MELILFAIFTLGLPIVGVLITTIASYRYATPAIDKLKMEDMKWEEKITQIKAQINIFRMLPIQGVVFGMLIFQYYYLADNQLPGNIENEICLSAGMFVGVSAFFSCIGMSIYYKEAIPGVIEDSRTYGKYLVLLNMSSTGMIYGLLSAILLLQGVGVIGGEPFVVISKGDALQIFNVALIFSVLSVSSILKGYLPLTIKGKIKSFEGEPSERNENFSLFGPHPVPIPPDHVFTKKLIYALNPEIGLILGLLIVIITFVQVGII